MVEPSQDEGLSLTPCLSVKGWVFKSQKGSMKSKTYQPGEIIIQKGEKGRDLFLVTEGVVEIVNKEASGDHILSEIQSPQLFGEISFLVEGELRTASARAKTEVEVFVFKYEDVQDQIETLPKWLKPILSTAVRRIKTQNEKIEVLEAEISELKRKLEG